MSMGGHSFHKKDWLELAALAAAGTAGAGAAGIGPLSGLLGSSAPAMALGGAPGEAELGAFGMGDKGLGLATEGSGFTGGPAGARIPGLLPSLGAKGPKVAQLGGGLLSSAMQPQQMPAPMGPRPGMGQQVSNTQLYPVNPKLSALQKPPGMSDEDWQKFLQQQQSQGMG